MKQLHVLGSHSSNVSSSRMGTSTPKADCASCPEPSKQPGGSSEPWFTMIDICFIGDYNH